MVCRLAGQAKACRRRIYPVSGWRVFRRCGSIGGLPLSSGDGTGGRRRPRGSAVEAKGSKGSGRPVIKVKPRGNESVQQLLRRFKRLCQREGLTRDIKRTSYYEKPSERRRRRSRKSMRKTSDSAA